LDDYSRKLLYADFFKAETTWAHIRSPDLSLWLALTLLCGLSARLPLRPVPGQLLEEAEPADR
jgi:hypothetical protein